MSKYVRKKDNARIRPGKIIPRIGGPIGAANVMIEYN
jgi:hypothetical protein